MTNRNGVPEMEQEDVRTESGVSPEESAESSGTEAGTENAGSNENAENGENTENDGADSEAEKAEEKNAVAAEKNTGAEETKEEGDARYLRLAADFQNYKKRVEREKSEIYSYANEKIALDIIEVMDNFERALEHSEECADKQFAEGVEMIYKQLKGVLDKNNIVEIKAEGEDFDPNFHNAVISEENPDFESGKVIQALQKGYTLNDKVIRPSMVRVAQ